MQHTRRIDIHTHSSMGPVPVGGYFAGAHACGSQPRRTGAPACSEASPGGVCFTPEEPNFCPYNFQQIRAALIGAWPERLNQASDPVHHTAGSPLLTFLPVYWRCARILRVPAPRTHSNVTSHLHASNRRVNANCWHTAQMYRAHCSQVRWTVLCSDIQFAFRGLL